MGVNVKIEVEGLKEVAAKYRAAPGKLVSAIGRIIKKAAYIVEAESKKAITMGPTRAIDTGRLRSELIVRELSNFRATIYPIVFYASFVHEGTRFMRARPFFEVAKRHSERPITDMAKDEIKQIL